MLIGRTGAALIWALRNFSPSARRYRKRSDEDSFGNALGNAVVDGMTSDRDPSNSNYRNEFDRESDSYVAPVPVAGSGLQPRRSGSGIQLSAGAKDRWSNDIDKSIANRAKELADIEQAQRFMNTVPLAALDINEGDPTPLRLRSAAEFRDLGRSAVNGLIGLADLGLMTARGALRLYDRNPDGSPNLKSLTAPILDDWRLNYESDSYRDGLGLFGEMLTGAVAPAGLARLGRIRGFGLGLTSEGGFASGAAAKTHATEALWTKNAGGARSLEEAVVMADEAGSFGRSGMVDYQRVAPNQVIVDLGDGVKVKYVSLEDNQFAKVVMDANQKFASLRNEGLRR